jgi:hypothetical protein
MRSASAASKFLAVLGLVYVVLGVAAFVVLLGVRNAYEQAGEQVPEWTSIAWLPFIVALGGVFLCASGTRGLFIARRDARRHG